MESEGRTTSETATRTTSAFGPTIALGSVMGLGTWLGFAFGVLAPYFVTDLGWSDLQAGSLTSVMYAAGALAASTVGRLVDRLGARRTALLVPAVVVVAHVIVAGAPGFVVMTLGATVGGIALAATNPSTNRLVVEGVATSRRGSVMGWKQAGVSVAGFTVGAVLPWLASSFGWRAAALAGAVVALALGPMLLRWLPRSTTVGAEELGAERSGDRVGRIATYAAIMGAVNGALGAFVVLYAVGTLELSAETGGIAVAIFGLVAVGARVGWATAGGRLASFVPLLRAISVLAAGGMLALALAPRGGAGVLLFAAAVLGGTAMSWHALAMLAAVAGIAVDLVGRVSGAVVRAFYGGYVIGPLVFGLLVDQGVPYRSAWFLFAVLALLAASVPAVVSHPHGRAAGARIDGGDAGRAR